MSNPRPALPDENEQEEHGQNRTALEHGKDERYAAELTPDAMAHSGGPAAAEVDRGDAQR